MKLNVNFNKELEPIINLNEDLVTWFERNQEYMAYFEFTNPGCNHFEKRIVHDDVRVLGILSNACLTCLNAKDVSNEEKVDNAINSIKSIYDKEKDNLSEIAKRKYNIVNEEKVYNYKKINQ